MKRRRVRILDVLLLSVLTACTIDAATKMDEDIGHSARQAFHAGDTLMKLGGAKNEALAAQYYKRAAEMGSHWGYYKYGTMLLEGKGVTKDVPAAAQAFAKAAARRDGRAACQKRRRALELLGRRRPQRGRSPPGDLYARRRPKGGDQQGARLPGEGGGAGHHESGERYREGRAPGAAARGHRP